MSDHAMERVLYRQPENGNTVPAFVLCQNGELTLLFVPRVSGVGPDLMLICHDDDRDGIYEDAESNWFNVSSEEMLDIAGRLKAIGSTLR
jgi:hypothetical protein